MKELTQYVSSIVGWFKCIWEPHDFSAKREVYTLTEKRPNGDPVAYVFYNRCCSRCGVIDTTSAEFINEEYDPRNWWCE